MSVPSFFFFFSLPEENLCRVSFTSFFHHGMISPLGQGKRHVVPLPFLSVGDQQLKPSFCLTGAGREKTIWQQSSFLFFPSSASGEYEKRPFPAVLI